MYSMDKRNIQKTGGSSYIVTLPKDWVLHQGLDTKGIVELSRVSSDVLIIRPSKAITVRSAALSIDYLSDSHILRELIGLYVSGADEIAVLARSITYEQRTLVRSVCYKLIGFELFEETSSRILLKNVASPTITAAQYTIKMLDMVSSMFHDIVRSVETSDRKLARDIIERDVEVDRIELMILRQFNGMLHTIAPEKSTDLPLVDLHYYELVAVRLERIADHIVRVANTIILLKQKENVTLNKFEYANMKRLFEYFDLLKKTVTQMDKRFAHKIIDMYDMLQKNAFINHKIHDTSSINILIEDSLERMRGYIANIAEETINYLDVKATL